MVLRCVHQIVQAAARHIRSGWKAVLNVAQIAARDANDSIAEMGFAIARACAEHHGAQMWALATARLSSDVEVVVVVGIEYFYELIACLSEFAVGGSTRRPRFALGAIDTLHAAGMALGRQVLAHPAYSPADVALDEQPLYRVWMPVLRALHDVVMHTDDLEVRTRALDAFFALVMAQGRHFSRALWGCVLRDLVFSMFADLRDPSASRRFATVDDLELWFSTTLVKALRHVVALLSRYYPKHLPNTMMAEVLELLVLCIAQPSEVLGKIGTSCLQDLVRANYAKWDDEAWGLVCATLARLFNWSQPRELFTIAGASWEAENQREPPLGSVLMPVAPAVRKTPVAQHAANRPSPLRTGGSAASLLSSNDGNETPSPATTPVVEGNGVPVAKPLPRAGADGKPDYLHITLKCILQLLLIQTLGELFEEEDLYGHVSAHHLFVLLDCVDQSRAFAHRFNRSRKVRRRLVEMGVMPTMPSLLKQETGGVAVEMHILCRMHRDAIAGSNAPLAAERAAVSDEVDDRLATLMRAVLVQYAGALDDDDEEGARCVRIVAAAKKNNDLPAEAKRSLVVTQAWRASLLAALAHVAELAKSKDKARPFRAAVSRLWPELVDVLGVAAAVGDLDVVGAVQRVLAIAGTELKLSASKYTIEE
ncbi:guanine nucleotide exchange protein for ADP-robosylation factor [Coemansia sp. 'formosensis']|nr:guanine nucleotide exchange protein for ADP-robosylation factor [Coemansia sp. 'formosensis']